MLSRKITIEQATIAAGGSLTLAEFDLMTAQGLLGVELEVTGDGALDVEALTSIAGTTFRVEEGATKVLESITKASGEKSDGKVIIGLAAPIAAKGKLRITETGGANSVTIQGAYMVR